MTVIVWHDNEERAYLPDANAAFAYLLRVQSMSTDWAVQHEGWRVTNLEGETLPDLGPAGRLTPTGIAVHGEHGVTAVWHGGEYIELYWTDAYKLRREEASPPLPFEVINTYTNGAPSISTRADVTRELSDWLAGNRHELGRYLEAGI